jgi:hypothetical protein
MIAGEFIDLVGGGIDRPFFYAFGAASTAVTREIER